MVLAVVRATEYRDSPSAYYSDSDVGTHLSPRRSAPTISSPFLHAPKIAVKSPTETGRRSRGFVACPGLPDPETAKEMMAAADRVVSRIFYKQI
jgi:hypothetical protein